MKNIEDEGVKIYDETEIEEDYVVKNLLVDMIKSQKENSRSIIKLFIFVIICYTLVLFVGIIGFFVYESRFDVVEDNYETYEYNQEGSGDGIEFNNVSGDMYKDSSSHNEE
ncbi:MAG: hypothetical protein J6T10_22740 [Methanobrevibacter sp.]|nr:hypothetical protein [Methanobrevibacter sp.]